MKKGKLVFVYNSTLNPVSLAKDFINDIFPQRETNCSLCSLTYSLVFQKKEWKAFVDTLPYKKSFLLKDMFLMKYGKDFNMPFPAVFMETGDKEKQLTCIITAEQINAAKSLDELKDLVNHAIKEEDIAV